MAASLYNCIKLAEYVDKKYSEIPSFLRKHGYDENEDYSIAYRTA